MPADPAKWQQALALEVSVCRQGKAPLTRELPSKRLAEARAQREEAKKLLENGTDPSVRKKLDKLAAEKAARWQPGVRVPILITNGQFANLLFWRSRYALSP